MRTPKRVAMLKAVPEGSQDVFFYAIFLYNNNKIKFNSQFSSVFFTIKIL